MGVNTSFTPMCAQQTLEPSEIHLQEGKHFDQWTEGTERNDIWTVK